MAKEYQVTVGNIGTVYDGESRNQARMQFDRYVLMSADGIGRASNESVILWCENEILDSYEPDEDEYEGRKANPSTPAPPNSLMAKGEFIGLVGVDELDRLRKSADAPLMCYVFVSGRGYEVRKFKSREALRKAVTESGAVGPANDPSYWMEMVPPVVSYRRGR